MNDRQAPPPASAAGPAGTRRRWLHAAWALGALVVALAAWRVATNLAGSGSAPVAAVPVGVAAVRQGDFVVRRSAPGTVVPRSSVVVKSQVEGRLTSIAFRDGRPVKQGELLATVDPRSYQAQLDLARGQLASDTAALANAKATLTRYQALLDQQSIERQRVDDQVVRVAQYAAAIQMDQGRVALAELKLEETRIRAPISGMAGLREVDPDNVVGPSDPRGIVRITELTPTSVMFALPADDLAPLMARFAAHEAIPVVARGGDPARVLDRGRLKGMDNQVDPATGTIRLKAEFPNAQRTLFPNQAVTVELPLETLHAALLVPSAAIQHGASGTFVYVVDARHAARATPVAVDAADGNTSVVRGRLAPGASVVVDGADRLREGSAVAPRPATAEAEAAGQPAAAA